MEKVCCRIYCQKQYKQMSSAKCNIHFYSFLWLESRFSSVSLRSVSALKRYLLLFSFFFDSALASLPPPKRSLKVKSVCCWGGNRFSNKTLSMRRSVDAVAEVKSILLAFGDLYWKPVDSIQVPSQTSRGDKLQWNCVVATHSRPEIILRLKNVKIESWCGAHKVHLLSTRFMRRKCVQCLRGKCIHFDSHYASLILRDTPKGIDEWHHTKLANFHLSITFSRMHF